MAQNRMTAKHSPPHAPGLPNEVAFGASECHEPPDIQDAERRFTATFEQSAVGMAHMHETGRFIRVNQKLSDILGYSHETLLNKTFIEITHPDDLELDLALARQVIAGEIPHYTIDKRYLRADDSYVWCQLTVTPVRTSDGRIDYYSAVIADISDRKNMEIALRESAERFQLVVYSTRDAIYDLDFVRGTVWWSEPYSEVFGSPPNELRAGWQWWLDRISPQDRDRVENAVNEAIQGGDEFFESEYQFKRQDGSLADVKNRGFIARDAQSNVIRILGTTRDLTDQKQAEKRMQEADRMALIGNLASGLSHDMSNIVQPMRFALERITHMGSTEQAAEPLNILRTCVDSLASYTNSVRRLSRGEELGSPQIMDLAEWWEQNKALYHAAVPRTIALKGDITQQGLLVKASPDRLTRAVLNMIVNAAEAITGSSKHRGLITVWSQRSENGEHILLGVRDNGPGIPPELRQRIFEPLFSTKKHGLSTGMGMSVISGFAKDCGGSVDLHSEPSQGTDIILRLPSIQTS